ncbi:hypothetical protein AJ79_01574 [Helicocarpus griseus UAMH5409]|uniref:Zn(2)-C6 fungal-type domain-containing protein n=1 Tax=Helicocarpus griseus UAMH5409 TaxID=1447875 RepID=A0A2B7Y6P5_9EURO|nr:hypothetical protein AJ79_01574 [Helicocarpus griseus UAMH5409]
MSADDEKQPRGRDGRALSHPITAAYSTHDPACDSCRLKKIRCGRERPQCINCERNGLECAFSGRGKRPNQNQKVIEDINGLHERLGAIDTSISKLAEVVQEHVALCQHPTSPSNGNPEFWLGLEDADEGFDTHQMPVEANGTNSYFDISTGSFCLLHLLESSLSRLQQKNTIDDTVLNLAWNVAATCREQFSPQSPSSIGQRSDEIRLPPRGLLMVSVEIYFAKFHWRAPILSRSTLLQQINHSYDNPQDPVLTASEVVFNCIIVQSLGIRLLDNSMQTNKVGSPGHTAMDAEFMKGFVENALAALNKSEILLNPCIANIQALVSLYMISVEHCALNFSELLLYHAISLAKCSGLHRQPRGLDQSPSNQDDRCGLFWTLYIYDKTHSQLFGKPCMLPLAGSNVPLPKVNPDDPLSGYIRARAQLSMIEERIYEDLHDPVRSAWGHQKKVLTLDQDLRQWKASVAESLEPMRADTEPSSWQMKVACLELEFLFYSTLATVHQRIRDANPDPRALENSRLCIRVIRDAVEKSALGLPSAILSRTLLETSFRGFFTLCFDVLENISDSKEEDIQLVYCITDFIQNTDYNSSSAHSGSYRSRLTIAARSFREIITLLADYVEQAQAPRPNSDASHLSPQYQDMNFLTESNKLNFVPESPSSSLKPKPNVQQHEDSSIQPPNSRVSAGKNVHALDAVPIPQQEPKTKARRISYWESGRSFLDQGELSAAGFADQLMTPLSECPQAGSVNERDETMSGLWRSSFDLGIGDEL